MLHFFQHCSNVGGGAQAHVQKILQILKGLLSIFVASDVVAFPKKSLQPKWLKRGGAGGGAVFKTAQLSPPEFRYSQRCLDSYDKWPLSSHQKTTFLRFHV